MASNSELEERWIAAWNDLADLVGVRWDVPCVLPDGAVVSVEDCKGWLQRSAYEGWKIEVKEGWVLGKRGVVASRWRGDREETS